MSWFKVDDKFHDHPKARRAGLAACGLWLRAGSWSADQGTDGFVPDDILPRWGGRGVDVWQLAETLVDARLWERDETGSEPGYRFRKWAKYQPTRAAVTAKRDAESEGGRRGNHVRHHVNAGIVSDSCEFCVTPTRVPDSPPARVPESPPTPPVPSRPGPDPSSSDAGATLRVVDNHSGLTDDDLDKIAEKTNSDREHARRVAADILDRADGEVRKPLAYVLRALVQDPARYRRTTRVTKATECPTHPGQLAGACPACRVESLDPSPVPRSQKAPRRPQ